MPKFIRRPLAPKTKRKFAMYSTQSGQGAETSDAPIEIATDEKATGSPEEIENEDAAPQESIEENKD